MPAMPPVRPLARNEGFDRLARRARRIRKGADRVEAKAERRILHHGGDDEREAEQDIGEHWNTERSAGGERREEIRRGGDDGVLCQHQFKAGNDVHDGKRCEQRHDAGERDSGRVDRPDGEPRAERAEDGDTITLPGLNQRGVDGGAEAHIGGERQVDAAGHDIRAARDDDDRESDCQHARDGRLAEHVTDVAHGEEKRRAYGEDRENANEDSQRAAAQRECGELAAESGVGFACLESLLRLDFDDGGRNIGGVNQHGEASRGRP